MNVVCVHVVFFCCQKINHVGDLHWRLYRGNYFYVKRHNAYDEDSNCRLDCCRLQLAVHERECMARQALQIAYDQIQMNKWMNQFNNKRINLTRQTKFGRDWLKWFGCIFHWELPEFEECWSDPTIPSDMWMKYQQVVSKITISWSLIQDYFE